MNDVQVAFLGPQGTYAHTVALRRYGAAAELVPQPSIEDVFGYVKDRSGRYGLVPIENSSGGTIYSTIDLLIDPDCGLVITEELRLVVKLALVGHDRGKIKVVYSHFAPFRHCDAWLSEHLPGVYRKEVASTAEAARLTAGDDTAAALAGRDTAELYNLKILEYPVTGEVPNVTQFVTIGREPNPPETGGRTSLVVALNNEPGALASFIGPLSSGGTNLTRIISRPVHGQPETYMFFIELDGTRRDASVARSLEAASRHAAEVRIVGEYPASQSYES